MIRLLTLIACGFCISGCVGAADPRVQNQRLETQRPASAAEKSAIADYVRMNFFDPYSVRDARLSYVFDMAGQKTFCLAVNAKNQYGAYVGNRLSQYAFSDNGVQLVNDLVFHGVGCGNPAVVYRPFPELETTLRR